jgi:hypothetical protein
MEDLVAEAVSMLQAADPYMEQFANKAGYGGIYQGGKMVVKAIRNLSGLISKARTIGSEFHTAWKKMKGIDFEGHVRGLRALHFPNQDPEETIAVCNKLSQEITEALEEIMKIDISEATELPTTCVAGVETKCSQQFIDAKRIEIKAKKQEIAEIECELERKRFEVGPIEFALKQCATKLVCKNNQCIAPDKTPQQTQIISCPLPKKRIVRRRIVKKKKPKIRVIRQKQRMQCPPRLPPPYYPPVNQYPYPPPQQPYYPPRPMY